MSTDEFHVAFQRARQLHERGEFAAAERAYRGLLSPGEHREVVLRGLVDLYLHTRRVDDAINSLAALTEVVPDRIYYYARLAALLDGLGRTDAAIGQYRRFLERVPDSAAAQFNLALLYRKVKRHAEAMAAYETAVENGIDEAQEVYSNMGVLHSDLHRPDQARAMFERALEIDPDYIPALFNLAGWYEESGDREHALGLYRRILEIDPGHWESLTRIAYATRAAAADGDIVNSLRDGIRRARDDHLACEGLYFALGKSLDDLQQYDDAFAAYEAANRLGSMRNAEYRDDAVAQAFDRIMSTCTGDWIERHASGSPETPVFICGMFRSGTTLVEQILAGHPAIDPGGELDILPWLVSKKLQPYPDRLQSATREDLRGLAGEYTSLVRETVPGSGLVTDKRPDNFVHLGLIKALFPGARIIYTRRDPMDNCLSIYFQQLGGDLAYATSLKDTARYYRQHARLMAHWMACPGPGIHTIDYDELVRDPEPAVRGLLAFLGLDWDERCLAFRDADSRVKTASVWQVRGALSRESSGRWQHYRRYLEDIGALLDG